MTATFQGWGMTYEWSWFLATVGGILLNNILKLGFDRPRPQIITWGTHVLTSSFPSGHAMSAATVYGTIAYLAARLQATAVVRDIRQKIEATGEGGLRIGALGQVGARVGERRFEQVGTRVDKVAADVTAATRPTDCGESFTAIPLS